MSRAGAWVGTRKSVLKGLVGKYIKHNSGNINSFIRFPYETLFLLTTVEYGIHLNAIMKITLLTAIHGTKWFLVSGQNRRIVDD